MSGTTSSLALFAVVAVFCASHNSAVAQSSTDASTTATTTTTTTTTTTMPILPAVNNATTRTPTTRRSTTAKAPSSPIVTMSGLGTLHGYRSVNDVGTYEAYLGIPYANPPVGNQRFRAPAAYSGGEKDWDSTKFAAACCQTINPAADPKLYGLWLPNANISEDCLYLNVWKPVNATPTNSKAVMVWIHGGGYFGGSASEQATYGDTLALMGNVVVVSLNYRLGPLGFLSLNDDSARGNYGLLDQQLALRWVHDHIAAFGGDPARVTLFGQSAGGASVSYHLMSKGSSGLFQSGIIESTVATAPFVYLDQNDLAANSIALAKSLGCKTETTGRRDTVTPADIVSCLRSQDAMALTNAQWSILVDGPSFQPRFVPTVDGTFLTTAPQDIVAAHAFQSKSIIVGANSDEGAYFLFRAFPSLFQPNSNGPSTVNDTTFLMMVSQLTALNADQTFATAFEYSTPSCPGEATPARFDALSYMLGDRVMTCPVTGLADAFAAVAGKSATNVYVYLFEPRDPLDGWPSWAGAALHGDEVDYVFGNPLNSAYSDSYSDPNDQTLSRKIIAYWTNFAKNGDPTANDDGSSTDDNWPVYTTSGRKVLTLDKTTTLSTQVGLRDRQCSFWDVLIPQLGTTATQTTGNGVRTTSVQSLTTVLLLMICACLRIVLA